LMRDRVDDSLVALEPAHQRIREDPDRILPQLDVGRITGDNGSALRKIANPLKGGTDFGFELLAISISAMLEKTIASTYSARASR
jgi:hypothetical protein